MICFVVLCKNSEKTLKKTLASTHGIGTTLVVDTGSTDNSLHIAQSFPHVRCIQKPFTSFGALRNEAAALADSDWLFALDSDEELSPELKKELQSLTLTPNTIYRFPFVNYFRGKAIRYCGWSPDYHAGLYNRKETAFTDRKVHESLETKGFCIHTLTNPVYHYSYHCVGDFIKKMDRYTTLFAEEYVGVKNASLFSAITHGFWAFLKTYLLKKGFLDGPEGYMISAYNAQTAYYKYLKLREQNAEAAIAQNTQNAYRHEE